MNILRRYVYVDFHDNFDLDDFEEHYPRQFFTPRNPFEELSRKEFIKIYRLGKERVSQIINIVRQYHPLPCRKSSLDVSRKVLTALRFFATSSYQIDIGLGRLSAVSQPSVSRSIHFVIDVMNRNEVMNEYVQFFRNFEELCESRNRFFEKYRFPHAVGCIDCTHIAIVPPGINDPEYPEHIYVNRKGWHSLNVQLICDSELKIKNVNASYSGNTHDCHIWNQSNVQPVMQRLHEHGDERFYLLGDSGYPLRKWLMTPFKDPLPGTPEEAFNRRFCCARSVIERVNGVLKMRFRCLLKHRVLHYHPTTAAQIVNTCCILHNMAITDGLTYDAANENIWLNNGDFGMFNYEELDELNPHFARVNPDLAAG